MKKSTEKVLLGVLGQYAYKRPVGIGRGYNIHPDDNRQLKAAFELQDMGLVSVSRDEEGLRFYTVRASVVTYYERQLEIQYDDLTVEEE